MGLRRRPRPRAPNATSDATDLKSWMRGVGGSRANICAISHPERVVSASFCFHFLFHFYFLFQSRASAVHEQTTRITVLLSAISTIFCCLLHFPEVPHNDSLIFRIIYSTGTLCSFCVKAIVVSRNNYFFHRETRLLVALLGSLKGSGLSSTKSDMSWLNVTFLDLSS